MTTPAPVFCLYPGCGIRLTDPISAARGFGPDHDPHPELRKTIRPPRARTPPRAQPQTQEDDLLALLDPKGDQQ